MTDIAGAIRLSDEELTTNSQATGKVIILISDGGQTTPGDPLAEARAAKDKGIRILSVGLGLFFNLTIMRAIASRREDFYFTPESADLITIFDPECDL